MSLQLLLATSNKGKLQEFQEALSSLDIELVSATEKGVTRFPEEQGSSYAENALLKAGYAALATGLPSIADDSGLEVAALDGSPGIYSARFGGDLSNGERIAYLLNKMREVPRGARSARFVCAIVLATPSGQIKTFEGECAGEILEGPRGEGGFGYDPIFFSPELNKTFAEASKEEKRRVSHRGRALKQFLDWALTPTAKRTMKDTLVPAEDDY